MKNLRAVAVLLPLFAALARAAASHAGPTLEPPPGWRDVTGEGKARGVIIALKGPETSSFIVKRAPSAPLDNPAGVRGYLNDVLGGMRDASKKDYRSSGRIETRVFRNGLAVQFLRAQLDGADRLVLAAFSAEGAAHVAALVSAAPEAMLPSLLGAISYRAVEVAVQTSGAARSSDGQLELALGGGLRARSLIDAEAAKGFVLVVQGAGSEIIFLKLSEADATNPGEQAAIVRAMAAAESGVETSKTAPVREAPTAAGPVGVYSWAPASDGDKLSVGYLPWGYWGYQLFGRGPAADELLVGTLAALKAGPSAVPGLLSATPRIPVEKEFQTTTVAAAAALGVALLFAAWSLGRKKANLPS